MDEDDVKPVIKTEMIDMIDTNGQDLDLLVPKCEPIDDIDTDIKLEVPMAPIRTTSSTATDGNDIMTDEIERLAFEEMCEQTIKELHKLFPEVAISQVLDALIQSDWSVFTAADRLVTLTNCPNHHHNTNGVPNGLFADIQNLPKK